MLIENELKSAKSKTIEMWKKKGKKSLTFNKSNFFFTGQTFCIDNFQCLNITITYAVESRATKSSRH